MQRISWPNRITLFRLVMIAPFLLALLQLQDPQWGGMARVAALVIFCFMAVSDVLDGYLARRLHEETAIGRFLDPCADILLVVSSVVALGHEGTCIPGAKLPAAVAIIIIGREIIQVLGFAIVYMETSRALIEPRRLGKWCMVVLMAMVLAILLSPDLPPRWGYWLPRVLWWLAAGLAVLTFVQYFRLATRFLAMHEAKERAVQEGK